MSTGFNAGLDSSDTVLSYGVETVWGTLPTVAFQAVRMTAEGFSESKTRGRPAEIKADGQAAHAITQSVESTGSLNFAFSFFTYDDLLEGWVNGTWGAELAIDAITTDVTVTDDVESSGNAGFTSTLTDKFNTHIIIST